MPESSIILLLRSQPKAFMTNSDMLQVTLEKVKGIEFNPSKTNFCSAICILGSMNKSTWDRKVDVYKKWGRSGKRFLKHLGSIHGVWWHLSIRLQRS